MELLIAVLLYLGLLSGTGSYTTTELQALVQNNYQAIETTTSSTSAMQTINGDYLQLAGGIEIIDKNVGN